MSAIRNAVIAAAGLGSRLGLGMPKAIIEINDKPLLGRLIEALRPHVTNIYVVIGYREELIIKYCAKFHPDVILVRNPSYRSTNTAQSYALAAKHLKGKTLFIDGDILVEPNSIREFFEKAAQVDILVGLTPSASENAVFVEADQSSDTGLRVLSFSREIKTEYEWANVVSGPPNLLDGARGYVFEKLVESLPHPAALLTLSEVDTAADLQRTGEFAARYCSV